MAALKDILKDVEFKTRDDISGVMVENIAVDSRIALRGDLFIAMKGYSQDAYKFIGQAISKGVKVILAERDFKSPSGITKILVKDTRRALPVIAANFYGHPSGRLKTVGVTGTNGKTTITYLIENILKADGKESGVIGTINYRLKGRVIDAKNTTPGPLELQSLLSDMVKGGLGYAIMEVSSHSLDQGRVDNILFDTAIFTNITPEHLDYHKDMRNYFSAKAKLFRKLKRGGAAILNNDDRKVRALKRSIKGKVITYGVDTDADIKVKDLNISMKGSAFTVVTPRYAVKISARLIGRHNVSNILASIAAAYSLGIGPDSIKKGIDSFTFVPGRLETVEEGQDFKVFVDFAHTEDALVNVLGLLRSVASKDIITVFGCGGNRDVTKRPLMGRAACKFSDNVIITSDNPRFEAPSDIIKEIEAGVKGRFSNYYIEEDRYRAIEKAIGLASKDDIVLIAGKGHERHQIIREKTIPFDDCKVAKEIINNMKIEDIIKATKGRLISGKGEMGISPNRVSTDSRTLRQGDFFIALKGRNFDGDRFVMDALKKGAIGAIVTRLTSPVEDSSKMIIKVKDATRALAEIAACHRSRFDIPLIGVTGSNGKTTVKEMLGRILSLKYSVLKNEGTENNHIGVPRTLLRLERHHDICVLEIGMNHKGEIGRLVEIARPTACVITNIGPSHLEFLGNLRRVFESKMEIFEELAPGALSVLNGDDYFLSKVKRARIKIVRFGFRKSNDFRAEKISVDKESVRFRVNDKMDFELNVLGVHNIYNALAAIAAASDLGIGYEMMRDALREFRPAYMRLNVRDVAGIRIINDAYNSNPLSMRCALDALRDYPAKNRWIVAGDMLELGKKSGYFHKALAKDIAASGANGLLTFGELSRATFREAKRQGIPRERLWHCRTHEEAAEILKKIAGRDDAILIKGSRGMEMEKIVEKLSSKW